MKKYLIPQISAMSLMSSAIKTADGWSFRFNATDPSKEYYIEDIEQDNCMMFSQATSKPITAATASAKSGWRGFQAQSS